MRRDGGVKRAEVELHLPDTPLLYHTGCGGVGKESFLYGEELDIAVIFLRSGCGGKGDLYGFAS